MEWVKISGVSFFNGLLAVLLVEALGRPQAAKAVLPVIGRMPTIAQGDPSKPGLIEGLFSKSAA